MPGHLIFQEQIKFSLQILVAQIFQHNNILIFFLKHLGVQFKKKTIQNCEYQKNLFFEIMFEWFRKPETNLKKVR
jgi:hypothetical protein